MFKFVCIALIQKLDKMAGEAKLTVSGWGRGAYNLKGGKPSASIFLAGNGMKKFGIQQCHQPINALSQHLFEF